MGAGTETWTWAKEHVPALTALLTVASLAPGVRRRFRRLPIEALPSSEGLLAAIPHVNAVVSPVAIGTITAGVRAIRRGDVRRHQAPMTTSFGLFALFLALYLYRVAVFGPTEFTSPAVVRTYVYLPVLFVHVALAVVCVPFVFYASLIAGTRPVAEMYGTRHRTAGRVAASPWLVSLSMGIAIYRRSRPSASGSYGNQRFP
ncbi:DUF420 domain-containing protein [Halobacteriales archaeon QS_4_69_225]|nr:MAG: DUF420 domain-containing protein [Halobacteriales archaeon QS_4_69_225]